MAEQTATGKKHRDESGTIAFDDAALLQQCRRGDMQAFGALVAKYADRIFNVMLRMCSRRADAEELTQEAFLKAMENISQFRGTSGFYTWLFRIAANLALSHRRRAARIKFHSLDAPANVDDSEAAGLTPRIAAAGNPAPDETVSAAETNRRVEQALAELDDDFRLAVILRDVEDMDYAKIASVLSVPVGTVKSRIYRARCQLRDKLKDLID